MSAWVKSTRAQAIHLLSSGVSTAQVVRKLGCDPGKLAKWRREALSCKRCGEELAEVAPDRMCGFCRDECALGAAKHGKAAVL